MDPRHLELAGAIGTGIAARGWQLVTGGGSVSMMGAVGAAARGGGARTVGVIPAMLRGSEVADLESDELVETPDMRSRKHEMDRRADAFLALPGGIGTLEELLEVWTARSLRMHDKPVVVCDPEGVLTPLRVLVESLCDQGFVRPAALHAVSWTDGVDAALDAVSPAASTQGRPAVAPPVD